MAHICKPKRDIKKITVWGIEQHTCVFFSDGKVQLGGRLGENSGLADGIRFKLNDQKGKTYIVLKWIILS